MTAGETGADQQHPAWCDRSRCTAEPASQADGYNSRGDQHRSADIPLRLRGMWWPLLEADTGTAFLTESVAPWRCAPWLRITVGDNTEVSMPVEDAAKLVEALSELVAAALADLEVPR